MVQGTRFYFNQNFVGLDSRIRNLGAFQYFWSAVLSENDCFHDAAILGAWLEIANLPQDLQWQEILSELEDLLAAEYEKIAVKPSRRRYKTDRTRR